MSTATLPYFHSACLRERYRSALDNALGSARLSDRQSQWLQALIHPRGADDPDPVRVDQLAAASAAHRHAELSAALLLSHALTDASEVYLFTLGLGLEVFADRVSLLAALRARYAQSDVNAIFEYQKVDGDPFKAQMLAIVDYQAQQVGQLTARLRQIPALRDVRAASPSASDAQLAMHYSQRMTAFWAAESGGFSHKTFATQAFEDSVRDQVYRRVAEGGLTRESRDALFSLLKLIPGQPAVASSLHCCRLGIRVGDSASCALAGTFVIKPADNAMGPVLWFSPGHDWLSFADSAALTAHFATPSGREQLTHALALADHQVMQRPGDVQVGYSDIQPLPGVTLVDTIITRQARNLVYAMGLPERSGARSTMLDDALDVRQLLDPRQLRFAAGRWRRQAPFDFVQVWVEPQPIAVDPVVVPVAPQPGSEHSVAAPATPVAGTGLSATPSWRERTLAFDQRAERLRQLHTVLVDHAEQSLQRYLCVWVRDGIELRQVRVQWLEPVPVTTAAAEQGSEATRDTHQSVSIDLVSLLLECVSGRRDRSLPVGAEVLEWGVAAAGLPPVELIDHLLDSVCTDFAQRYAGHFLTVRRDELRDGDRPFQPLKEALSLREDAMRLYLDLAIRQKWIDSDAIALVREVLDQPVSTTREAVGPMSSDACQVQLAFGDGALVLLCDTLVLRRTLAPQGPVVFWSSVSGWQSFPTPGRLQHWLGRKLRGSRERWLEMLGEADRRRLCDYLDHTPDASVHVRLRVINGHAIETLQQDVLQRQVQDVRQLCQRATRGRFDAGLFARLAAQCEMDSSLNTLIDGLSIKVETSLFEALLPPWLNTAPIADLERYCDLLKQYYVATDGGKHFLFGISSLHSYARKQLSQRLTLDFPGQGLDADRITVNSRSFVNAFPAAGELPSGVPAATVVHSESLTDYAINRFAAHQGAVLSVFSAEHPQVTHTMTPDYLRQLVRSLNVGAGYVGLLRQALNPNDPLYETRKRLFVEQLPPMLLAIALAQKLKGTMSVQAHDLLSSVFEMPDGIAREPVNGVRAIFGPLQLVADEGMTPDALTGVFVICPEQGGAGPVVLYAVHHDAFTFYEYASRADLLEDIRTNEELQALLLERVEPEVHRRYAHGGFTEPHLPFSVEGLGDVPFGAPGPMTFNVEEVKGNALRLLFKHTTKLLLDMGISNSVTNEQEDHAGNVFLATLGFEQALSLLPGKLAAMVTLWQSQMWLRASAASASGRHWGEAFSEFVTALGVMVTAREQAVQEQVEVDLANGGSDLATDQEEPLPTITSWRSNTLDAEQRMRLQRLQAQGVALTDMRHDELLNLYVDTETGARYAVVSGKVYQVQHIAEEGKWIIVGADGTSGPKLTLDTHQRWHLDLSLRLRGGGGVVTKVKAGKVDKSAQDILVIEARGMPEIRLLYRDRARRIGQAHLKAKRYLETCLDNLSPLENGQPLDPRVSRIIGEFFGVSRPGQGLLTATSTTAKSLFGAIMDASLSPFSSQRFVVGSTRPGHEMVTAFVIKSDPKQRLYLTEQFFLPPLFAIKPDAIARGFSAEVHHRAANLIHELSHLVLDTHDVAYLESMAPFPDMLLEDTTMNTTIKANVTRLHETRLSHRSDRDLLFTMLDAGRRRDIQPGDGRGFEMVLKVTHTHDLDDARDVFLSDDRIRSQLILRNADSVTLLMLQLGRENFVVPSP